MTILIIEPHGDDAFISGSSSMTLEDTRISVMTFSDRFSDLKRYYESIVSSEFLDVPDVHYDYRLKYSTHEIHKEFLNGVDLWSRYQDDMDNLLSTEAKDAHDRFRDMTNSHLDHLKSLLDSIDIVLAPFGLFHPNHYATRKFVDDLQISQPIIYYVDKPYIEKRYVQEILKTTKNYVFALACTQNPDTKREIYKSLYPTEQGLLRYSEKSILVWKDIYAIPESIINNSKVREFLRKFSNLQKGVNIEDLIHNASEN